MPMGGSGVTAGGAKTGISDLKDLLASVSNLGTYQSRLATLDAAEKKYKKAKRESVQAIRSAEREAEQIVTAAEAKADEILRNARASEVEGRDMLKSEQATHQHNVEVWETERRSKQGQLSAAKGAARKAKEEAQTAEASAKAAEARLEASRQAIESRWQAAKDVMRG